MLKNIRLHSNLRSLMVCLVMLAHVFVWPNIYGQSGAGSIQGNVTDTTGAVIPGTLVSVVQQGTGSTSSAKANGVGFYQVPNLFTGTYYVTFSAPGMKGYKTTVELQVAQNAVVNPALSPGSVSQEVVVSADVIQLTTPDSGTITSTLENSRINQLPMNGRSITSLLGETTPGLEAGGARANGLMAEGLEYVADGVSLSNREFGGATKGTLQMPDPDSIQEARMVMNGGGAEYATPAAGILTTKSGTNALHGTLFETARNNAIGIAKARQNPSNYAAPHYVRNEFGASVGGPIFIPKLYDGRNKSFFFFAFERYSLASNTNENVTVPSVAERQGDFSGLVNSAGVLQQLYDPATTAPSTNCNGTGLVTQYCRAPFMNNHIPLSRLSPTAKTLYDIIPLPNSTANPLVTTNLQTVDPNNAVTPSVTFRLDHQFTQNDKAFLRYTSNLATQNNLRNQPSNQPATIAADGFPTAASGETNYIFNLFAAAVGYNHVFSPTFFSETVVSQQWWSEQNNAAGTPFADFETRLGLPNNFGEPGFPSFTGIITPLNGTQFQYGLTQIIDDLDENMTKIINKHELHFGGRYRHERFGLRPDENPDNITFGAQATALENPASGANYTASPNTGLADGDFFLGAASSYTAQLEPPYNHIHDMEIDLYLQDNFHVSSNFTVNAGLRYEDHPAPVIKGGLMTTFDLAHDAVVTAVPVSTLIAEGYTTQVLYNNALADGARYETPAQAGLPDTLLRGSNFTFGPRLGFAYEPFGSARGTVLRGAYGRYIYPDPIRDEYPNITRTNPLTAAGYSQSYTSASQSPDGLPNYLMRAPQSVIAGINSSGVVNSQSANALLPGFSQASINPDYPPDFVTQTNATVEQPLKGNSALRVSWVYTHGTNLGQRYLYNNHPSTYVYELENGKVPPTGGTSAIGTNQYSATATGPYDQVTWGGGSYQYQKSGWSNDNALQVNYQRLFHRGVAYQVLYVWSKAFRAGGNSSTDSEIYPTTNYANSGVAVVSPDYGPVTPAALGPARPANLPSYAYWHDMDRFQNYIVDTAIPKQHVQFNGIIDLPFGRGKKFFGNSSRFVDELIGGFQIAGDGSIASQDFAINATNWGATSPLKVYKHGVPITDCRSGVCLNEYMWFNGYIAPTANANTGCTSKCVSGLPANYTPYQTPIDITPTSKYYGSNEVDITLPGQTSSTAITYAPSPSTSSSGGWVGANPFSHTVLNGPMNYSVDLSLFKVFSISDSVKLRVNVDAFNAFNIQGYVNPNTTDGTEVLTSSYNTPRQIQITARLTF